MKPSIRRESPRQTAVSSGGAFRLECTGISRAGTSGRPNQDAIAIVHPEPPFAPGKGSLLIVADGVGGYAGGEIASTMACEQLVELYYEHADGECRKNLRESVGRLNTIIYQAGREPGECYGMCTTLVAAVVAGSTVTFVHTGDSKALLFRRGNVAYASADHSITVASFEASGKRYLTQSLGARRSVIPSVHEFELEEGDIIVLCSDGLSDILSLGDIIEGCTSSEPAVAAAELVSRARANGGTDDVSVVIVRVLGGEEPA